MGKSVSRSRNQSTIQPDGFESARHRLLIIEDHPIVSSGLSTLIGLQPDLEICGVAADRRSAIKQVDALRPDLVLLDITLKDGNGLELLKRLKERNPQTPVLMLSMHDEMLFVPRALRAGASGYVMKHEPTDTLLKAIREVVRGGWFFSPRVTNGLLRNVVHTGSSPTADPQDVLSRRQWQVFCLMGRGKSTHLIAEALGLSVKTVESHRGQIRRKLNIRTTAELMRQAVEAHLEQRSGRL
jgi:DNA-binding NarL/FixJ family response regulator